MYARYIMLRLGPDSRALAERIADEAFPIYQAQEGFKSVFFLADDPRGEHGSLSVWESRETAEKAIAAPGSWLRQSYGARLQGPPETRMFEIYDPQR